MRYILSLFTLLIISLLLVKFYTLPLALAQEKQCFVSLGGDSTSSAGTKFCYFHYTQTAPIANVSTIYYCQGNTDYVNICDIGFSGCGPTTMAMVFSSYGIRVTPVDMAKTFATYNFRQCGRDASDMVGAINSDWFKNLGFIHGPNIVYNGKLDVNLVQEFVDSGWLLIASSDKYPCFSGLCKNPSDAALNHMVVIDGVNVLEQKIHIRDSNNCSYKDHNDENDANLYQDPNTIPWTYAYPVKKEVNP